MIKEFLRSIFINDIHQIVKKEVYQIKDEYQKIINEKNEIIKQSNSDFRTWLRHYKSTQKLLNKVLSEDFIDKIVERIKRKQLK